MKFKKLNLKNKKGVQIILGGITAVIIPVMVFTNTFSDFYENISSILPEKVDGFEEVDNKLNILVFPFENYSGSANTNISYRIYEKIKNVKEEEKLDNLEIKFFKDPQKYMDLEQRILEGDNYNANFIISGSYEQLQDCNGSICIYDFHFIKAKHNYNSKKKIEFSSVLRDEEKLLKPLEFYVYFYLGILEMNNGGELEKSLNLLKKARDYADSGYLKSMTGILIAALKFSIKRSGNLLDLTPDEAGFKYSKSNYGTTARSPIFTNGFFSAAFYLNSLKYKGEYVNWSQNGTITDSLSPKNNRAKINVAKISSSDGSDIGNLYFFMDSNENKFLPIQRLKFSPNYTDPLSLIKSFMLANDSIINFPEAKFKVFDYGIEISK